ncbi:MAG: hypothetical protein ACPHL4_07090 [Acidimicrobiales bacterium]|nr:hypothetical protein [Actinomycetota bacterium]
MDEVQCPACGETENLAGRTKGELIEITCETCDRRWSRDPNALPTCERCGSNDMEGAVKAVVEKSRGSQLSIVATQVVYLCRSCDESILASYRVGRSPLMPDQLPTQ